MKGRLLIIALVVALGMAVAQGWPARPAGNGSAAAAVGIVYADASEPTPTPTATPAPPDGGCQGGSHCGG